MISISFFFFFFVYPLDVLLFYESRRSTGWIWGRDMLIVYHVLRFSRFQSWFVYHEWFSFLLLVFRRFCFCVKFVWRISVIFLATNSFVDRSSLLFGCIRHFILFLYAFYVSCLMLWYGTGFLLGGGFILGFCVV